MRLINFILLIGCFYVLPLSADSITLVLEHDERSDTLSVYHAEVDSILSDHLNAWTSAGYWNARVHIQQAQEELIKAEVIPGDVSNLTHIHFSGLPLRHEEYLSREFKMGRPSISSTNLPMAEGRVAGMGYRLGRSPSLSIDASEDFHMAYTVEKYPEIRVQGLATFNQSGTADTLSWHGQVNVSIPNFDGKGKSFDFAWERLRANSESFNIGLRYPWIFQMPLGAYLKFGREVVDGYYQVIQTDLGLVWDIDWERSIYFNYGRNESIITHAGSLFDPEWVNDRKRLLGLGYRQSSLDERKHQGIALRTTLFQELNLEPESIKRINLRSESQYSLIGNVYISQRTAAVIQNQTVAGSDPSILRPLGGVNSVRGYEEAFIRTPNLISMQQNLHYSLGGQSQLLAFWDIGFHNAENSIQNIQGYGVGIQLRSGRGPIRIILASHQGLKLGNSFLHIEYSGGNAWIDR